MKRNYIDQNIYDKIMHAMKQSGVPTMVFEIAKKMDMNLPRLFYEKILKSKTYSDKVAFANNLIGVYGNYFAMFYYKSKKFNVQNEVSLYDNDKKFDLKADLGFMDNYGMQNYCEVKASPYVGNITNYYDSDDKNVTLEFSDKDLLKYDNIGRKLLKQVERLLKYGKVTVVIFKGCAISKDVMEKLLDLNVEIKTLAIDIKELENFIDDVIQKTLDHLNKKNINPSKKVK